MSMRWRRAGSWVRRLAPVVAIAAMADVSPGQGLDDLSLTRTFGAGVHAYFSGDLERSYDEFTAAIEAGSEDPRARYFRGLAALRLGRLDEAEADFSAGADLEARALGGWPVSRSLERIQGHDRLRLERHRVRARVAALQLDRAAAAERYSGIEDAQPNVLRSRRPTALPAPAGDASNPFIERPEPVAPATPTGETPEPSPVPDAEPPAADAAPSTVELPVEAPAESPFAEPEPELPFGGGRQ